MIAVSAYTVSADRLFSIKYCGAVACSSVTGATPCSHWRSGASTPVALACAPKARNTTVTSARRLPPASSTSERAPQALASTMPRAKITPPRNTPSGEKLGRTIWACPKSITPSHCKPCEASRATASASAKACSAGAWPRGSLWSCPMPWRTPRSRQKRPQRAAQPKAAPQRKLAHSSVMVAPSLATPDVGADRLVPGRAIDGLGLAEPSIGLHGADTACHFLQFPVLRPVHTRDRDAVMRAHQAVAGVGQRGGGQRLAR